VSYDVSTSNDSFNITSNMSQFFTDFDAYPPDFSGRRAFDVADIIQAALQKIIEQPVEKLVEYDAPNGWGDWLTATGWLMRVRDSCLSVSHDEIVEVSW